jgi:hypothetical protein
MEAVVVGQQLADLERLAGSARTVAPALMGRRSHRALANRRLTNSATEHRRICDLHLPLRTPQRSLFHRGNLIRGANASKQERKSEAPALDRVRFSLRRSSLRPREA